MSERWNRYFHTLALASAGQSRCLSRRTGAVIVKGEKFIVSSGYNGPPIGFPNPGTPEFNHLADQVLWGAGYGHITQDCVVCPRRLVGHDQSLAQSLCPCAHAERNAIDIAARLGHPTEGCTLYVVGGMVCVDCAYSIVNSGITKVIVDTLIPYNTLGFTGGTILAECGVKVHRYERREG